MQILPLTMTSLPMPAYLSEPVLAALASAEKEQFLLHAFRSFAAAAASLEHSYGLLRTEVERLHRELETSHTDLERSLEENRGMRQHRGHVLEGLPCGVLVVAAGGEISRVNPEAVRLLGLNEISPSPAAGTWISSLRREVRELLERARAQAGDQEL